MTEREYKRELKEIEQKNEDARRLYELRQKRKERNKYKPHLSTTKLIVIVSGIITFGIILYACYEMHIQHDLTALYALVGIAASEVGVLRGYMTKATAENSAGGLVYDLAMANAQKEAEPADPSLDDNGQ